jgi:pentatricopeptide repeat protein
MLACGVLPNVFTSNILVHSLCKVGELGLALDLLRSAEIDTVTYNTVIWGLCKQGLAYRAFGFLSEMVKKGVCIDSFTCNILVNGFCQIGLVKYAKWVMDDLVNGGIHPDVVGFNALINRYCKAGEANHALKLMESILLLIIL